MSSFSLHTKQGFTLVELIAVIVVLGVVSVGISGFIRTGMSIYTDVNERDQILSDSRFLVERLNRELRGAIPNSARLNTLDGIQCIEFVPALWVTYYTSLSVFPDTSTQATIVEIGNNIEGYTINFHDPALTNANGDAVFVYPTDTADIYNSANNKQQQILSCIEASPTSDNNCNTLDEPNHTASLNLTGAFAEHSPASRMYFARNAVSYCVQNDGDIFRYTDDITANQIVYGSTSAPAGAPDGVLMAQNITNTQPFTVTPATLRRNGLVNVLLTFDRNDEIVNYNVEVHIPNVP